VSGVRVPPPLPALLIQKHPRKITVKINGNAIRIGNVIEFEGKLWVAVKTQHTQPGKGGAYMQVELKNLVDGTKKNERFRSSEQVERVYLDQFPYQYLYEEGDSLIFMDQQSFEQISLSKDFVGDAAAFLQDGMIVDVSSYEGKPLSVQLPDTVVLTITEADPVIKGQTASSSYKPAKLENGLKIMVPPHIESGMRVVVNTADATYVERAKD
jgi:elongation factor P